MVGRSFAASHSYVTWSISTFVDGTVHITTLLVFCMLDLLLKNTRSRRHLSRVNKTKPIAKLVLRQKDKIYCSDDKGEL